MAIAIDFHVHTALSPDGRSSLLDLVQEAKKRGLSGFAVSDHNLIFHPQEHPPLPSALLEDFILVPACEFSTDCGHILGLFLDTGSLSPEELKRKVANLFSGEKVAPLEAVLSLIQELKGIAVVAHPYGSVQKDDSFVSSLFGVEVANARAHYKNPHSESMAKALAERYGKLAFGGSDAHHCGELGNAYSLVQAESLTVSGVKEAVLEKRISVEFPRKTTRVSKAKSQWEKARKSGELRSPKGFCRYSLYLVYSMFWDLFHR